jgi:membrane-bound ClpP family serine protease
MLGFPLTIWDYLTFLVAIALVGAFLAALVFILGLPGRIAIARNHPDADAISTMGWLGFLAVVPWMQAFMWAFKPTDVVDIRYFPKQEQQNIGEELARLKGKAKAAKATNPHGTTHGEEHPSASSDETL